MNLQTAMTLPEARGAAHAYHDFGLSVIPCKGKQAIVGWARYARERSSRVEIARWFRQGTDSNVAIICGAVSGNLVVIDLDGDAAIGLFRSQWAELMRTLTVHTGSGHGLHLYYKVRTMPQTTRHTIANVGNIEVRGNGTYVIAPPSIHPETKKRYLPGMLTSPMELDNLEPVLDWLTAMQVRRHQLKQAQPDRPIIGVTGGLRDSQGKPIRNPRAYGRASLESEIDRLIKTPEGGRNNRLRDAAFRLAQLIEHGALTEGEIRTKLFIACLGWSDMTATEITKTIESGMKAGKEKPNGR